jgi:tyrosyl-tRNA synthetase
MMRHLQDLGHTVIFLLGDMTTRIGDPTGRSSTRPVLGPAEIESNAAHFLEQVTLVLRNEPGLLEVRRNSEWFDRMSIPDLLGEFSLVTHAQLMGRDMFQQRIAEHREIALHELVYPVLQGYDSVALESDLTIVGSDQLFNEAMGRSLQAKHGQVPQTVITSTITPGLDGGPKQSKSLGNYVGLAQSADEKFGRLMTLHDDLLGSWATAYTDLPLAEVADLERRGVAGGVSARDAKVDLAGAIVARYHGEQEAERAREAFLQVFSRKEVPEDVPEATLPPGPMNAVDLVLLVRPELSRSAIRRLLAEGAVSLDQERLTDPSALLTVRPGQLLRVGRRRWFRMAR